MSRMGNSRLWGKITVLLAVCGWCLSAQAKYGGGSGEPNDPYLIYDANQMQAIGADANDWDKCFKLMADIDLGEYEGEEFNIIGTNSSRPFAGIFDGNGHTISDFTYGSSSTSNIGLFGYVRGASAEIKNLGLIAPNVDAGTGSYVGSLVGWLESGTITDCYSTGGSVEGGSYVGGLVGRNYRGTVSNCYSTTPVTAAGFYSYVGGLVGYNGGTISNCYSTGSVNGTGDYVGGLVGYGFEGTITNCYSEGSVTGDDYVGGLVGRNEDGTITECYSTRGSVEGGSCVGGLVGLNYGTITNCYSNGDVWGTEDNVGGLVGYGRGTIANCYSEASVTGDDYVGGLVGTNRYKGTITNCYSTGSASGDWVVGGLVGRNYGTISNCYSTGSVNGYGDVGGLVGWNYTGTISDCYSTGSVSGTSYVGGLAGTGDPNLVTASFWDKDTSGWTTSAGGECKTTAEMMTQSTFTSAGWDFLGEPANGTKDTWRMCVDGVDYPRLTWEYVQGGDFACPDGVNAADLEVLCEDWLSTYSQALYGADANADKHVTFADFAILAQRWLSGL